jgi:hypothetical protein
VRCCIGLVASLSLVAACGATGERTADAPTTTTTVVAAPRTTAFASTGNQVVEVDVADGRVLRTVATMGNAETAEDVPWELDSDWSRHLYVTRNNMCRNDVVTVPFAGGSAVPAFSVRDTTEPRISPDRTRIAARLDRTPDDGGCADTDAVIVRNIATGRERRYRAAANVLGWTSGDALLVEQGFDEQSTVLRLDLDDGQVTPLKPSLRGHLLDTTTRGATTYAAVVTPAGDVTVVDVADGSVQFRAGPFAGEDVVRGTLPSGGAPTMLLLVLQTARDPNAQTQAFVSRLVRVDTDATTTELLRDVGGVAW